MKRALALLRENGLEVLRVKVAVRCIRCQHEWQLRLLPDEIVADDPNPNWGKCWICRQAEEGFSEVNDMGGHS